MEKREVVEGAASSDGRAVRAEGPRRGWYLRCTEHDIAERVVLVGDPGRVEVFARSLQSPRIVNTNRALNTVTGLYNGVPVSVAAFGMGAPIMAVVLEEVVWLGAKVVLRAGTAMSSAPGWFGKFIVADAAVRGESTSGTYVSPGYPAVADDLLVDALSSILTENSKSWGRGVMASYDGFYSELFALDERRRQKVLDLRAHLRDLGISATDMETSALLTIGNYLGVQCGSLCLVTVDGETQAALEGPEREEGEADLVRFALEGVTRCALHSQVAQTV
jgi:uridine phosphorylase